jgi:DNA-binding NtrC family response regulator
MPSALILDESQEFLLNAAQRLASRGFNVLTASNLAEGRDSLLRELPEWVLVGETITARRELPRLESVLSRPELEDLVEVHAVVPPEDQEALELAERLGAALIHEAPLSLESLESLIGDYLERMKRHTREGEVHESGRGLLIGESEPMLRLYRLLRKISATDVSVLVSGESGTGKELVSRTLHELSARSDKPFVAVNSGAVPENLAESELFGHVKGAFSGAEEDRVGSVERADGGTLFLDEITEMPEPVQVKLLRVLETGEYQRLGSGEVRRSEFRVIAACNRDPLQAVADGQLRNDLFYRLAQFPLELPPLRDRGDDIRLLARHFLKQESETAGPAKQWTDEALQLLSLHHWPGNVRELRNLVAQAYILGGEFIAPEDLPAQLGQSGDDDNSLAEELVGQSLEDVEKSMILETLKQTDGNKRKAARILGISPKTLYARLKSYGEADS